MTPTSSWQDYASSGITGAVSLMVGKFAPSAKNAVDAVVKPIVKQSLEIAWEEYQDYDIKRLASDSVKRYVTSFLKTPSNGFFGKLYGNLPCNMARGGIRYVAEKYVPIFGQ